jgi:gamma-glutamylcyclotransferase (GGCT)/AIG2-like uncharacterized protein YtfP
MIYFAYGSNLDFAQMRKRCPSAQFVAKARLPDCCLAFTRKSIGWGCGVADVRPASGQEVWGVVYNIAETEIGLLDKAEGYRPGRPLEENAYVREQRHVFRDGDAEQPLVASIYIANPQPNPPLPNSDYKSQIVDGARFWHLPGEYVAQLEQITVS